MGTLFIVATPIGNLEDITFRAVRILKEVDLIAAEDTRHSLKLLNHFGIRKPLTSYFDHNQQVKGERILSQIREGKNVALISDAGTPAVSDPGYQLVRDAIREGITVVPVPGPSAAIAALSASGLPTDSFTFVGFLPSRQGKRREKLSSLCTELQTLIFYESPARLTGALTDMAEILGPRPAVVARELTKLHEAFTRLSLPDLALHFTQTPARGEVVILVHPAGLPAPCSSAEVEEKLRQIFSSSPASLKDAVKTVASATGIPKAIVYSAALRIKK